MAKCIKVDGKIERVSDREAERRVKSGNAQYCPKNLWKKQERKSG